MDAMPSPEQTQRSNADSERSRLRALWTGIKRACSAAVPPRDADRSGPGFDGGQSGAAPPSIPLGLPSTARKIGYHGTSRLGYERIQSRGIAPSNALRTGVKVDDRSPVFYITDRWESALSYASGREQIFEIWCIDCALLRRDAFRRNAQGVAEVKIRGGFETLVAVPASTEKHLPVSFHLLGFSEPSEPARADRCQELDLGR